MNRSHKETIISCSTSIKYEHLHRAHFSQRPYFSPKAKIEVK